MLDYVGHLRAEGAALARAATGNLHLAVPSCPGWTVADLVAHAGRGHRHKLALLRAAGTRPSDLPVAPSPPTGDALIGWLLDGLSQLAELLAATDPDAAP
ncbi:MAG TPA: maleylpyruvate isomerase N-terminal domain-containing protein, partial [Egibacteraceae bacterium]|nr:maleylpyruvate isomerase N-terminal domain-containing protein [Egibacteraceae bacterium]